MILVNGVFHDGTVAPFDYGDRGLTLADGLFETMAVFNGIVFCLTEHLDRLLGGCTTIGLPIERQRLEADVAVMAARAPATGAVMRLTVTRGAGVRGLAIPAAPSPTVIISLAPFNPALVFETTSLGTVTIRRNEFSPLSRLKSLSYLDNILALREAQGMGAKDALVLNTAGRVACSSVANIFCVRKGEILTPPSSDGILPGIMRGLVPGVREHSLTPADLIAADAVFLTNSVRLVQPVQQIDRHAIRDDGTAHRVLTVIKDRIRETCNGFVL